MTVLRDVEGLRASLEWANDELDEQVVLIRDGLGTLAMIAWDESGEVFHVQVPTDDPEHTAVAIVYDDTFAWPLELLWPAGSQDAIDAHRIDVALFAPERDTYCECFGGVGADLCPVHRQA